MGGGLVVAMAAGAYLGGFVPDLGAQGRREAAAWNAVRATRDVAALESYLASHPEGAHAAEARARISGLLAEARQAVEAEAARLRAEADAAKKRAEIRPVPESVAATPPLTRATRFDGVWVGEMSCPEWRGRPEFRRPQRVVVQNGEMTREVNFPGRSQPIRSSGKIATTIRSSDASPASVRPARYSSESSQVDSRPTVSPARSNLPAGRARFSYRANEPPACSRRIRRSPCCPSNVTCCSATSVSRYPARTPPIGSNSGPVEVVAAG